MYKLVFFVPEDHKEVVKQAVKLGSIPSAAGSVFLEYALYTGIPKSRLLGGSVLTFGLRDAGVT